VTQHDIVACLQTKICNYKFATSALRHSIKHKLIKTASSQNKNLQDQQQNQDQHHVSCSY